MGLAVAFWVPGMRRGGPCVVSRCRGASVERGGGVHSYEKGPTGFGLRLSLGGCAEDYFRCVTDSVGFCGSRVCGPTSAGGRGVALFSSAA
ncbi:hypothetical protein Taro_000292, partial [Colocasia esculenta]|nr:hypothetical protein [Colocasia esculenta]